MRRPHGGSYGSRAEYGFGPWCQAEIPEVSEPISRKKLVVLELGIGWRNQLIKAPLMRLVDQEPNATYVTINLGEVYIADSIKRKSFGLDGSLGEILSALREADQR